MPQVKYENSGQFVNDKIDYPFNIVDKDGKLVTDFWNVITNITDELKEDHEQPIRYLWIDAGNYCQTEIFLKKIVDSKNKEFPTLYLHWIDFVGKTRSVYQQLCNEKIKNTYFVNIKLLKVCIIDHAECIGQKEQFLDLCKRFSVSKNKFLFIFVAKKDTPSMSYWHEILKSAASESSDHCLGITRSESNYYVVRPYTKAQCKKILSNAIKNDDIKRHTISLLDTLGDELRRPYYFDFLITELNKYHDISEMPTQLNDSNLIFKIFENSLDGVIRHFYKSESLNDYLNNYYVSHFVDTYNYGSQSRIPFDNYACAYGIICCSCKGENHYGEVLNTQFTYINKKSPNFYNQIEEINRRVIVLQISEKKKEINDKFVLKDYLVSMINYSINGALICASLLNSCYSHIDVESRKDIYKSLVERYKKPVESNLDIRMHYLLGIEIGKLLPKFDNNSIANIFGYLFERVCDDYIEPKCNSSGISVIPVTNYEFMKFVADNGYKKHYRLSTTKSLNEIAASYYEEIFDFIIDSLSDSSKKDSKHLARLLKGYDWNQYKQIAYLFSRKQCIDNNEIYKAISINYPEQIQYPAKWADVSNGDITRPFCNPLQPVVCVNLFEARAYAQWLESKINKTVRVLTYNPDYLSIIGRVNSKGEENSRQDFISHIKKQRNYINSIENSNLFYGKDDIAVKEPSPVAMPNLFISGLYDVVGNVFETQDTPFTYQYRKNWRLTASGMVSDELVEYNCAGGGLQRTEANWPPEYMGQVPAFLRNQDIGFRIVVSDTKSTEEQTDISNDTLENIHYSESKLELYTTKKSNNSAELLSKMSIRYADKKGIFANNFTRSSTYFHQEKSAIVFTPNKRVNDNCYKEAILLIYKNKEFYAYHLIGLSHIKNNNVNTNNESLVIAREPLIPKSLALKKRSQSKANADWLDVVKISGKKYIETYTAYPINISNGYFKIANRSVRNHIVDGIEKKRASALIGLYQIYFKPRYNDYKKDFYDSFKDKLGTEFFLPDWIDIVDFIHHIASSLSDTTSLDVDTVMAAITTIDTVDLHEQINTKILNRKKKGID